MRSSDSHFWPQVPGYLPADTVLSVLFREFDQNVWTIHGEPNTEVIINRPATVELTVRDHRQSHPRFDRRGTRLHHD
jgi:hypothetical protein